MGLLDMMRFVSEHDLFLVLYLFRVDCLPSRVLYRGKTERFNPRWRWIAGLSTSWRPDAPRRPGRTTSIKGRDHAWQPISEIGAQPPTRRIESWTGLAARVDG